MKTALLTVIAALSIYSATAEPTYIMVRKKFSKIVMKYVSRPSDGKLKRWYYDQNTDTYYRAKGFFGIFAIPIMVKGNSIGNDARRKEAEIEQMYTQLQNERNKQQQTTAQQPIIINTPATGPATVQTLATPVVYQPDRSNRDDQNYRTVGYDRSDRSDYEDRRSDRSDRSDYADRRSDRSNRSDYADRRQDPERHVIIEHRYYAPRPSYNPYYTPRYYQPYRPAYYPY
jgi:hypothetical protein